MTPNVDSKRFFDVDEANALIPTLTHYFNEIMRLRNRMRDNASIFECQPEIEAILDQIVEMGMEVADVDLGIVNFYTNDGDEDLILSWQYGEECIHYWHEPFEDFCHRRPLHQIYAEAPPRGPAVH